MTNQGFSSPTPCRLGKQAVSNFAEQVASSLQFDAGADLESVVQQLGGTIKYQDIWQLSESGSIEIHSADHFEITLAAHTSKERDNFTIAHELGHYFLHFRLPSLKGAQQGPMRAARYGGDLAEIEANWFAASFLMPEQKFRSAYKNFGGEIAAIARHFAVSSSACLVRAKSLGLEE